MRKIFDSMRLWIGILDCWKTYGGNVSLGIGIVLLLQFTPLHGLVGALEDYAVDFMMRLQVFAEGGKSTPSEPPLVFIDIDQATYQDKRWDMQNAYHVPRDKLLNLIKYAAQGNTKAILVDVDLSRRGTNLAHDNELRKYLESYDGPDLFLMQSFEACCMDDSIPKVRKAYFQDKPQTPKRPQSHGKDEKPHVHWVQPLFKADPKDHEVRRWHLLKAGCLDDKPVWIPSAQLAIDMLLTMPDGYAWDSIRTDSGLDKFLPHQCGGTVKIPGGAVIKYENREVDLVENEFSSRIIYSFFDGLNAGGSLPGVHRISAAIIPVVNTVEEKPGVAEKSPERTTVVVIGASYRDSQDIHHTPMGDMPGVLVVISAIKSFCKYQQLHESGFEWILEIIFVFVMAYVFKRCRPFLAGIIVTILSLIVAVIGYCMFKSGVWVGFVAPYLGMQLHRLWAELEIIREQFDKHAENLKREASKQTPSRLC